MLASVKRFLRDDLGASLVEYALIVSLVGVTCLFGLSVVGTHAKAALSSASTATTSSAADNSGGGGNAGQGGGSGNQGNGHGGHGGGG